MVTRWSSVHRSGGIMIGPDMERLRNSPSSQWGAYANGNHTQPISLSLSLLDRHFFFFSSLSFLRRHFSLSQFFYSAASPDSSPATIASCGSSFLFSLPLSLLSSHSSLLTPLFILYSLHSLPLTPLPLSLTHTHIIHPDHHLDPSR